MKHISDPRSGYYRANGKGRMTYESFVPMSLQNLEINVTDEEMALADKAMAHLIEKDKVGDDLSRDAVLSSVNLAWNMQPECLHLKTKILKEECRQTVTIFLTLYFMV